MSEYNAVTAALLALIWGGIWAACLQFTDWGKFLAERRTWLTAVVGVGVDLVIFRPLVTLQVWCWLVIVVATSSAFIILRSLYNELRYSRDLQRIIRKLLNKGVVSDDPLDGEGTSRDRQNPG